ncbi:unnamed protein product [Arabidopsis arenosa]|uniref:Purine permease n=1 Tax=Arabidopsis arenosa TaxID=38785 RepID=A0A8S1ZKR8_ARAAE|nr:unnamed protein product [Arabidopsis arenosa]
MLLLNFFYVQGNREEILQSKGTWIQALIQNVAFPILIPLFFIFPKPKQNQETNNTRFLTLRLFFLYFSLGVLVAAHSKLFALGKLYVIYGIFTLISATQLIFTAIFTAIINRFKFTRWIIISIILTILIYVFGSPEFGGEPNGSLELYSIQALLTYAAPAAFALSLCLVQLGFEKVLVKTKRYGNKKVFRMVLEMQICVSFVASVVCLVGLFASGENKEMKGGSHRFKKGEMYYVLSLIGLALSWQVWAVGLIGLVLYVSGVFGDVVHMCTSPLVALFVVLAFDFMDDEFSWPRIGALIGTSLALGSYFYSLHKRNKKKMVELYQIENNIELNQKKWWIAVALCLFLVLLGDSLVILLLNFFYVQDRREDYNQDLQYKGTWMQALIQNAAFPFLIPLYFIFPSPKPNQETNNHRFLSFRLIVLYFVLGVLVAAHSKLYALGKLYSSYDFFMLISGSQLIFTLIFTAIINRFKFTRWIIISIILTLVSYGFGGPVFAGEPDESEYFYGIQAWLTFAASVAFALSLCLVQLGFEKLLVKTNRYGNKKVFRMVLEMQICVSFVASVVCLVGLFASGEYKELKGDSKRFKKGETYYVLSFIGLAFSWQVWAVGLIGLVLYVSSVFGNIVHMCASPLMAFIVVLVFDFMDDDFSWPRLGALIGTVLALGSYFYTLHKRNKKKMVELN